MAEAVAAPPPTPGDYPYSHDDFEAIAALAHAHAGICLPASKATLIYSRLTRRLRERRLASFADYVAILRNDADERTLAIEALATNHTKFFRENHHFEHFEAELRPALVDRLARGGRVRLWSSAASSGEEAYSLAMVLLGADRAAAKTIASGDVALLATDLSGPVLRIAETARYPIATADDIPERYRLPWTIRLGSQIAIAPLAQALVRVRKLNLLHPWPVKGRFDAIFCRNLMIYFDEPTRARLLDRLADQLAPGGYLYIGHSERLCGPAERRFVAIGQTVYRREGP